MTYRENHGIVDRVPIHVPSAIYKHLLLSFKFSNKEYVLTVIKFHYHYLCTTVNLENSYVSFIFLYEIMSIHVY